MKGGEKDLFSLLIAYSGYDRDCLNSHFSDGNLTKVGDEACCNG
jgi:hypothetical protein